MSSVKSSATVSGTVNQAVHVTISGRVQGVWYRAWTQKMATELGLSGWVRNRSDGRVEAVFCGPTTKVAEMIGKCRKGPPLARVEDIRQSSVECPDEPEFRLLPTL